MKSPSNMNTNELKEELRKCKLDLEDIQEEKLFALSQRGHIEQRLQREWEVQTARLEEQIAEIEKLLEKRNK